MYGSVNSYKTKKQLVTLSLLLLLGSVSCTESEKIESEVSAKLQTVVSILPQKYMVERIGGELVDVMVLVGPGQSPATYDPTPKQMTYLAEADIFFQIGVPFETNFLKRAEIILENTRQVKTQLNISLLPVTGHSHDGVETGGHEDPHIWLSPQLVKIQASNIMAALSSYSPEHSESLKSNYNKFLNELDSIDSQIDNMLAPFAGDTVFVFHPSYGYFTDAYSLTQVTLEPSGKEADAAHLAELMSGFTGQKNLTLFVQKQFASGMAETVAAAVNAKVVTLDPLAENYFDNLLDIATKMKTALEQSEFSNAEGLK